MHSTATSDPTKRIADSEAVRSMKEQGFFVFRSVLSHDKEGF